MASNQNRPAKRLSSLLSLGGSGSTHDLTEKPYSPSPSLRPLPASRDPSPARQQQLSNARSRSSSPVYNFSRRRSPQSESPTRSSTRSPTRLPSLGPAFNQVLADDGILSPPPKIAEADRTTSWSSTGSRPGSRAGSASGSPKLGASLSRPSTPPSSEPKLRKRRNWMPGRSRNGSQDDLAGNNAFGAWVVGAEGNVPYDVSPLATGSKVCMSWSTSTLQRSNGLHFSDH